MADPIISIIIPAYNAARFLRPTLDSIIAQTFQQWECIVIDDGSTDETPDIMKTYCAAETRMRCISQPNAGMAAARTRGFAEINSNIRYIAFMDGDDLWFPDSLRTLFEVLEQDHEAIGVHALADLIDTEGRPINPGGFAAYMRDRICFDGKRIVEWEVSQPSTFSSLFWRGRVYPPGVMLVRRVAYEKVGPWDNQFKSVADWDMCVRLSRLGYFHFLNEILIQYRRHGSNVSSDNDRNVIEIRRLYCKMFNAPENTEQHRMIVRKGWRAWQLYRIKEKRTLAREQFQQRKYMEAFRLLAHIPVHFLRYLRGRPTENKF